MLSKLGSTSLTIRLAALFTLLALLSPIGARVVSAQTNSGDMEHAGHCHTIHDCQSSTSSTSLPSTPTGIAIVSPAGTTYVLALAPAFRLLSASVAIPHPPPIA